MEAKIRWKRKNDKVTVSTTKKKTQKKETEHTSNPTTPQPGRAQICLPILRFYKGWSGREGQYKIATVIQNGGGGMKGEKEM